ncbi:hypothetical protein, partial [Xanthomonas perforans]|uniref:hypothetical protein n=1 Tax=Xanthomonas perforans TaxID=442694 RepID=UPI001F1BEC17
MARLSAQQHVACDAAVPLVDPGRGRRECATAGVRPAPAQDQPMRDTAFVSPDQIRSWFAQAMSD